MLPPKQSSTHLFSLPFIEDFCIQLDYSHISSYTEEHFRISTVSINTHHIFAAMKPITRIFILFFALFGTGFNTYAQGNSKLIKKGEQLLKKQKSDDLLDLLEDSNEKDPMYNYYMAMALYSKPERKRESLPYFEKHLELTDSIRIEHYGHHHVLYLLGQLYHLTYQFDKAEKMYVKFTKTIQKSLIFNEEEKEMIVRGVQRDIAYCKFARIAVSNPRNAVIESLGDSINSIYADYAPVVSQDEKKLIFTSRRPIEETRNLRRDEIYEDVYSADLIKGSLFGNKQKQVDSTNKLYFNLVTDFEYANFKKMDPSINTGGHEGSIQLHNIDKTLYFYRNEDIWSVNIENGEIGQPEKLGVHINSDGYEPSLFISSDEKLLFIVSDRLGGFGGLDIYVSRKTVSGEWSKLENMGPNINTEYDEDSPYLDPNGKRFYFSSKGHSSMGGYDIFKSSRENGSWTEPVNMGHPINTPADDIYFSMTTRYNRGYYASSTLDGKGDMDLYRITFADERDPVAELIGLFKRGDELIPANSRVTLTTLDGNESIDKDIDTLNGEYFLLLGHGKAYNMVVETEGFAPYQQRFIVPEQKAYFQLYQEVHHEHVYDSDGNIIGQQVTVYNAFGESDSLAFKYDKATSGAIAGIKSENALDGSIKAMSELKFYITEDSLKRLMKRDKELDFDLPTNVSVAFLKDENIMEYTLLSHEEYTGSLKREYFLSDRIDAPTGAVAVQSIQGLFYTVQIGVYSRDVDHSVFYNLDNIVTLKTQENQFRYSIGTHQSVEEATSAKDGMVELGLTDAFVTAYYRGKRITIAESYQILEQNGEEVLHIEP